MPKMQVTGLDGELAILNTLAKDGVGVVKTALYEGAHITYVEAAGRIAAMHDISEADREGLLTSMYHSRMYDENDTVYAVIGFTGYNSNGVPNILVARSIELGHAKRGNAGGSKVAQGKPFMRKALNSTKKQVISKIQSVISQEIAKMQKG